MTEIYKKYKESNIIYKDFEFPLSVKNFSMKEGVKVATYEYAGRNGAEHERVLNYRTFSLTGEFIYGADSRTPKELVDKLREQNDNKPGIFTHPNFGSFNCIISNLSIEENGDGYTETLEGDYYPSFSFSLELYEHTPPNSKTLKEKNNQIFSKTPVKPKKDDYQTKLLYKNCDELYNAIMEKKILSGVNPVVNAEWLRYDYEIRKCAYDKWKAGGFKFNSNSTKEEEKHNIRKYKVKIGDSGTKIAKKFNISFSDLFQANRGIKVRENNRGSETYYRKTARKLYPGDIIIIP